MRIKSFIPAIFFLTAMSANADEQTVSVDEIRPDGVGDLIGTIQLTDSSDGLVIKPAIQHLKPGRHGFHVHEKASCDAASKDGVNVSGLAAGGHFDPKMTGKHLGPHGDGHMGDLNVLEVDKSGNADKQILLPRLTLAEIRNHALIIHEGGDNYSDDPKPLGGGGARIACGVIN